MVKSWYQTVLSVTGKLRNLLATIMPSTERLAAMREISPRDYVSLTDAGQNPFLLDVREGWEVALAAVPGAVHIPMGEIPDRLDQIPKDRMVVVMCKVGGRSMNVARFLAAKGHTDVVNLAGGILAWASDIDPTLATY
jgi:rhodanese-related sulfurtransferase